MNRYRNKFLITFVAIVLVAGSSFLGFYQTMADSTRIMPSDENSKEALFDLNRIRQKNNVDALRWNDKLADAASLKAEDMFSNNYFDHISASGKNAWDFVFDAGYDYKFAGENLAMDFNSVAEADVAWQNSQSHFSNMISKNFSDFGFAQKKGVLMGKEVVVYVEIFGSKI